MPKNILILSDMEFDYMVNFGEYLGDEKTLFENIAERYKAAGYKLPRLVFWNIDWHYGTFNDIMTALSLNDGNGMESVRNLSSVIEHGVCSDAIITFVLFVVFFVHFSYLKIVIIR